MRCSATVTAALLLLALAKTGYGLECDFCDYYEECSLGKDVRVVTCDEETVLKNNNTLVNFIPSLKTILPATAQRYECFHVRATSVSGHVFLYTRGCVHQLEGARHFCSLRHVAFQGSLECIACNGDRCNNVPVSPDDGSGSGGMARSSLISLTICSLLAVSLGSFTANAYS
uniref:Activin types I and II receptor domain-containing protein n=1 Tax=Anopheles maculatus TaxID=74869 RepID=A0A182SCP1_9DIPT